jgi:hypothetical protein
MEHQRLDLPNGALKPVGLVALLQDGKERRVVLAELVFRAVDGFS